MSGYRPSDEYIELKLRDAGCDVAPITDWGHESTDSLVERVRDALTTMWPSKWNELNQPALAALTELAERLRRAGAAAQAYRERAEAAERDKDELFKSAQAAWEAHADEEALVNAAEAQRDELVEALDASDKLIRMLRPDLSHTRRHADEIVKRNSAALAKVRG